MVTRASARTGSVRAPGRESPPEPEAPRWDRAVSAEVTSHREPTGTWSPEPRGLDRLTRQSAALQDLWQSRGPRHCRVSDGFLTESTWRHSSQPRVRELCLASSSTTHLRLTRTLPRSAGSPHASSRSTCDSASPRFATHRDTLSGLPSLSMLDIARNRISDAATCRLPSPGGAVGRPQPPDRCHLTRGSPVADRGGSRRCRPRQDNRAGSAHGTQHLCRLEGALASRSRRANASSASTHQSACGSRHQHTECFT